VSRARNLKPGFFKNEELAELPFEFRILFQGLWCLADRLGRLEYRPKRIKGEIFPYDEVDVVKGLRDLYNHGFNDIYTIDNHEYIQIVAFAKHQNPHCKEAASTIPAPCEPSVRTEISGTSPADSLNPITDSLNPMDGAAPSKRGKPRKHPIPADFSISERVRNWAREKGHAQLEQRLEHFVGVARARGYEYVDWDEAFMGAVRDNWAKLAAPSASAYVPGGGRPELGSKR
jgi:hypothetical protein